MASRVRHGKATASERILVHLLAYARFAERDEAPLATTQSGIAQVLHVRRNHVSMSLQVLEQRGLIAYRTTRILGADRRKRAYALTPLGYARARETQARLASAFPPSSRGEAPLPTAFADIRRILAATRAQEAKASPSGHATGARG